MTYMTTLPPDQAASMLTLRLTAEGAIVTSSNPTLITGTVAWRKHPSILVGVVLLCIMILPGLLWFMFARRKGVDPFAIQLEPSKSGGTLVDSSGTGAGLKACDAAIGWLPR